MKMSVHVGSLFQSTAPMIALGVYEGETLPDEVVSLLEPGDFTGKPDQSQVVYTRGTLPARRILLIGMGKRTKATPDTARQMAARTIRKAQALRLTDIALFLPIANETTTVAEQVQAIAEGAELGSYRYLDLKSNLKPEETHQVENLHLFVENDEDAAHHAITTGQAIAHGVMLARTLANTPSNLLPPARLADKAQEIAQTYHMDATIWDADALQRDGFGGILAVGQGSAQPPRFIVIEYGRAYADGPTICLVGKGITFDTGGISIKPAQNMDDMKMDMSGAAAVLGTMETLGQLKLPLHVVALVSSAENMPDANAYRPGDVITTLSGKTVEVLNTDAEGRIVLADALHYAQRYEPAAIIDLATLTGSISIALGPHAVGMMGNQQTLMDRLLHAGETAAERVWQLPLWEEYHDMLKSDIADLKNIGGRMGGSITAAAFLAAFVGDYHWVHLDIAGTAWTEKPARSYHQKGATGVGVRLLAQFLRDWVES